MLGLIDAAAAINAAEDAEAAAKAAAKAAAAAADPEYARIEALVEARTAAKKARDFAEADRIRDLLAAEGITLIDSAKGTIAGADLDELNEQLAKAIEVKRELLRRIDSFQEANPMLGTRGCRLGFLYPELNHMQFRAICEAAAELIKEGVDAKPEIMIPLVAFSEELKHLRWMCEDDIKAVSEETGVKLEIPIGTMIELPRAAITADHIAKYADFFSFGTNDLTQTCLGFSRDDVESSFLDTYMNEKLIKTNPFATLDRGVARLVQMGVEGGKATNPNIICGVCGETGGDPESIQKYYDLGLDYVSCSPFRVPIARLAAAQAKIKSNGGAKKLA
jgi:pyruvate,orthophosphate dikinase